MPAKTLENANDNQPEVLIDATLEENHSDCNYPSNIPLMNSNKEKLNCSKVKAVLRYHVPNQHNKPEQYAHHLLFMFYPFRDEAELCTTPSGTYMEKLLDPVVQEIVNRNKQRFEPCGDLVDTALANLRANLQHNQDLYAQQENDEVNDMLQTANALLEEDLEDEAVVLDDHETLPPSNPVYVMTDDEINVKVRSLNSKQRMIFEVINKWARDLMKNLGTTCPRTIDPLFIFITGGGGSGKSHIAKTIQSSLTKTFCYHVDEPDKPRVLVLAPTGVAAVNVVGNTIHSGLGIPVGN